MAAENPYPECGRGIRIGQSLLGRSSLAETFDAPDNQEAERVVKRVLVFVDESAQKTGERGVPDHEEAAALAVGEMGRVRTRGREGAA